MVVTEDLQAVDAGFGSLAGISLLQLWPATRGRCKVRRVVLLTAAGLLLLGAGAALANHGFGIGGSTFKQAAATFTATGPTNASTQMCTGSDGAHYSIIRATYSGSASGDPALSGQLTIDALSVINDANPSVGTVKGNIRINTSSGPTRLGFWAVYSGGAIAGLGTGWTSSGTGVVANLSANFSTNANTGFSSGKLGGGTAGGQALLLAPGGCTTTGTSTTAHDDDVNGRGFHDQLRSAILQQIESLLHKHNIDVSFGSHDD
jgi:hypothetical protein